MGWVSFAITWYIIPATIIGMLGLSILDFVLYRLKKKQSKEVPEEVLKGLISALRDVKEGKYEVISKETKK